MKNFRLCWSADFETTTNLNDCRVWAFALSNVEEPEKVLYGNSLDDFMEFCKNPKENYTMYFFNLKFDGSFILDYLMRNNYKYIESSKDRADNTFTTLITDTGQFYSIEIYFKVKNHHTNKVKILDAMKIFPNFSVDRLAKGFGLPISKLKLDYRLDRPVGHILTPEEIAYIRNDVVIVASALKEMFSRGLTKMTIAGDAMGDFKTRFKRPFRKVFPKLSKEIDADIRKSYRGGFTYLNPLYKEKTTGAGVSLDVNSLYPSCQRNELMCFGQPVLFDGKYEYDPTHPLYVQKISCKFKIKKGKIPSIQIKNSFSFLANEYLESSGDEYVELVLTKPDFELFMDHYDVYEEKYYGGYKFMAHRGYFDDYIDHWMEQKIQASKDKNPAQRQIAKLCLNSLYGRCALSIDCKKKIPMLDHNGNICFIDDKAEEREPVYIPVACFITAYGRAKTIRTSQKIRDWSIEHKGFDAYVYSDTDSIKALLNDEDVEEIKKIIEIDDYKLGAWALEDHFTRFLGIRQKCYITEVDNKVRVTVAGLPKYLAPLITFDNFKRGFSTAGLTVKRMQEIARENGASEDEIEAIHHKLTYTHVDGGVVLTDTDFTIM